MQANPKSMPSNGSGKCRHAELCPLWFPADRKRTLRASGKDASAADFSGMNVWDALAAASFDGAGDGCCEANR